MEQSSADDDQDFVSAENQPKDFKDEIKACEILQIFMKCREAIVLEQDFQALIKQSLFDPNFPSTGTPSLLIAENEILSLSTYSKCTDGIFYVMPLIFEVCGENQLYLRSFETGVYQGFIQNNWKTLFNDIITKFKIKHCNIVSIYNTWDVLAAQHRRIETKNSSTSDRNSKIFDQKTQSNKSSIQRNLPVAYSIFKQSFGDNAPGFVFFTRRMAKFTKKNCPNTEFYKMVGLGDSRQWKTELLNYKMSTSITSEKSAILQSLQTFGQIENLPIECQFQIISSLPNYHKWAYRKNTGVKKEQYFAPNGLSPRNLMIQSFDNALEDEDVVISMKKIIFLILKNAFNIKYIPSGSYKKRTKSQNSGKRRTNVDRSFLLEHLGVTEDDFAQTYTASLPSDMYEEFKRAIYLDGTLLWREKSRRLQTVVMNDYNSVSGLIKFNEFVTTTRNVEDNYINIQCTCETFKVLSTTIGSSDWDGESCMHARLLENIIEEFNIDFNESNEHGYSIPQSNMEMGTVVASKIKMSLEAVSQDVILLSSAETIEKFSVRSISSHQFVHIFASNDKTRVYVKCSSGLCMHAHSKKVLLRNLEEGERCDHLEVFKRYIDENWQNHPLMQLRSETPEPNVPSDGEIDSDTDGDQQEDDHSPLIDENPFEKTNGFDSSTGKWSFYSPYARDVNLKREDLEEQFLQHYESSLQALRDKDFKLSFYPKPILPTCACEIP
ncbi:uncharacterized protein [Clytia hemisphaerica]